MVIAHRGLRLGAIILWLAVPAQARTMQQKLQAACAADVTKLCPQAASEPDAIKGCLLAQRAAVSAACMRLIDASE